MGHSAKNQQIMNFRKTIYGFRDLLGRKFSDPYVQKEIKNLPFKVVEQKNDTIGIKVSLLVSICTTYPLTCVGVDLVQASHYRDELNCVTPSGYTCPKYIMLISF